MVLSSLTAAGFCGVALCGGCESGSAIGHGAKRSVAGEAVWCDGDGGLWRRKGWETFGSQTPTKTDMVGGQTASPAWAGTAQRSERGSND